MFQKPITIRVATIQSVLDIMLHMRQLAQPSSFTQPHGTTAGSSYEHLASTCIAHIHLYIPIELIEHVCTHVGKYAVLRVFASICQRQIAIVKASYSASRRLDDHERTTNMH